MIARPTQAARGQSAETAESARIPAPCLRRSLSKDTRCHGLGFPRTRRFPFWQRCATGIPRLGQELLARRCVPMILGAPHRRNNIHMRVRPRGSGASGSGRARPDAVSTPRAGAYIYFAFRYICEAGRCADTAKSWQFVSRDGLATHFVAKSEGSLTCLDGHTRGTLGRSRQALILFFGPCSRESKIALRRLRSCPASRSVEAEPEGAMAEQVRHSSPAISGSSSSAEKPTLG